MDFDILEHVLQEIYGRKGEKVVESNVGVARAGYQYAREHYAALDHPWEFSGKRRMVVSGNEMFGLGAVAAGCKFYAAYPTGNAAPRQAAGN